MRAPAPSAFAGIEPASGRFRCWLAEVEDALAVLGAVRRLSAARERAAARSRLVDVVADAGWLARVAPHGRIDGRFAARARREAEGSLATCRDAAPRLVRDAPGGGSNPEIGRALVERGVAIVEGARDLRFERRVARAMDLLDDAWPEAAGMIRRRVWRVVPVRAWGTVSYSSAREPGILHIDAASAPLIRLAEDLVHETVHARVHEIESIAPLVAWEPRGTSRGEPRFYSPWRREWRPLRGLIHAICTFTAGAIYFERILLASERRGRPLGVPRSRRRWLARRLLEERASVALSLEALAKIPRGMLKPAGAAVVAAAAREHRRLAGAERRRRAGLRRDVAGRAELAAVDRLVATLREQPVRWGWRETA